MKYVIAVVACFAEAILYALIGALLGWKHGGGIIPMIILFAIWGVTWKAITKRDTSEQKSGKSEDSRLTDIGEKQ